MLSYQHGYHAGNFADVHKHLILSMMLQSLTRKDKPLSYLETHSGRAMYDLSDEQAQKNQEFQSGISKLWQAGLKGTEVYCEAVTAQNTSGELAFYPGSPSLAQHFARANDKLMLMELHPQESQVLKRHFRQDSRVAVHQRDGYEGVLAMLPPKPNRGMVLIDPAYEDKSEYDQVVAFIKRAKQLWPNGSYAIWYPLLEANRWKSMKHKLQRTSIRNILCSEIEINPADAGGMYGSGMLMVNPPWPLEDNIRATMPGVLSTLAEGAAVDRLEWLAPE
ncbi:23S rRNA (adenine(2030)-N(6))-methyltransferase RlmJ [Aliamphritea spongicola]|uniref:23S rRNA (adenine(2030)-N(6))-methyltransferase RlmJ n=1 Tax=Aliamphritea spongicola TaxID=707589 RepID=UPI00196B0AB9|nr:23S rRNA (adenine(2030)-N(6))-methyltransferase RlmJ [Aliamphritea spongicola]MBN3564672.1 23S rRNA (adenine(2030)-N(6))-methyltransferase RlmJ [Aliamphritea spongicola]